MALSANIWQHCWTKGGPLLHLSRRLASNGITYDVWCDVEDDAGDIITRKIMQRLSRYQATKVIVGLSHLCGGYWGNRWADLTVVERAALPSIIPLAFSDMFQALYRS